MANAGVRGRPIAPLVLSPQERAYLERLVVIALPNRYLSAAARSCGVQIVCQASRWLPNLASMNTPLASGAADS